MVFHNFATEKQYVNCFSTGKQIVNNSMFYVIWQKKNLHTLQKPS